MKTNTTPKPPSFFLLLGEEEVLFRSLEQPKNPGGSFTPLRFLSFKFSGELVGSSLKGREGERKKGVKLGSVNRKSIRRWGWRIEEHYGSMKLGNLKNYFLPYIENCLCVYPAAGEPLYKAQKSDF